MGRAPTCAPGPFFGVHNLDTDSRGNLYATETYSGAREERFIYKGVGPVTKRPSKACLAEHA